MVGLHGLQLLLAYLLMLAAMTYNMELFLSVIVGLTVGYATFNVNLPPPAVTEPCCADLSDVNDNHDFLGHSGEIAMMLSTSGSRATTNHEYEKLT